MLLSLYFSEITSIWWGILFGFCFDVYFLHTIGIAFLVFPLIQVIFYRCNQIILVNRLTRFFTFLLTILLFQFLTNLLLILFYWYKIQLGHTNYLPNCTKFNFECAAIDRIAAFT